MSEVTPIIFKSSKMGSLNELEFDVRDARKSFVIMNFLM